MTLEDVEENDEYEDDCYDSMATSDERHHDYHYYYQHR